MGSILTNCFISDEKRTVETTPNGHELTRSTTTFERNDDGSITLKDACGKYTDVSIDE